MDLRTLRKKYFIDKTQYKILAIILIYIFVALLISGIMMFLPSIIELSSDDTANQQRAASELLLLHKRFWPVILIVTAIIALHSTLLFHRIFGPLYRFRLIFKQVAEGDLTVSTRIRKYDLLHEDEIAIREMITSLRTNIATTKLSHADLHVDIKEFERNVLEMELSLEEIREKVLGIQQKSKDVEKCLEHFTT